MPGTEARSASEFEGFYRRDFPRLVRILIQLGASLEDARDAAQESYARAWTAWPEIKNPAAWVRVTALREYQRHVFRAAEEVRRARVGGWPVEVQLDGLGLSEEARNVAKAIAALPQRQAQVMALTIDGYRPREIASMLSEIDPRRPLVNANTVSAALLQARRTLKKTFGDDQGGAH